MKTKHVNRRDFFRLSATAGVSAMLIPGARAAGLPQVTANENETGCKTADTEYGCDACRQSERGKSCL